MPRKDIIDKLVNLYSYLDQSSDMYLSGDEIKDALFDLQELIKGLTNA